MESRNQTSIHVRRGMVPDLPRILEIERSALSAAHWTEQDYEISLAAHVHSRVCLVAETAQLVQGFIVARSAHPAQWEIENIVVAQSARRRGFASALLRMLAEQLRAPGLVKDGIDVQLEVRESNLEARRFYEKHGFLLDTKRSGYYRDPEEDAILYTLHL
jgi:ribosomal-protein-alanine N-acetyltransferase